MPDLQAPVAESAGLSRRRLLFQRLKEKKEASLGAADVAIPRRGQTVAELSYAQQRIWVLEQMDPGNPRFCVLTALRLRGAAHLGALTAALREIVRRHEILRTRFSGDEGGPRQVVAERPAIGFPVLDLSGLLESRREALLAALLTAEAQRPFDLAGGPLTRVLLVRLGPAEHVLVLTQHQIVVDRWSRGLFVRELTTLYAAFVAGRPSPLPEPALQYADFAQWQRELLHGETVERLLGYWRRQLAGSPQLALPTDRPRPRVQRSRGAMRFSVIPRPLLDRLQAFSQAAGATLFMTLFAAFAALFHRLTGQEDLVLGSPIANRNQKQVEELMGFFVNMLALRVRLSGDLTFGALLERAKETAMEAYAHQDLPFELLVRELGLPRDLSRHPLFQVSLVVQNSPMPPLTLPDLEVSLVPVDWGTTAYDLAFFFWETALWEQIEDGLSLIVSYSTDLYDAATAARLVGQVERLLAAVVADPGRRLRDLEILAPAERHQLLCEWSGDAVIDADRQTPAEPLHRLVVRHAAAHPEAPAADFGDERVSYGELIRCAHLLARRLLRQGLKPEASVALLQAPSLSLVVSSLAVLMAGGTCLPIDPELPAARIEQLLALSGAAMVITEEAPHPRPLSHPLPTPGRGAPPPDLISPSFSPPLPVGGRGWERGLGGEGLDESDAPLDLPVDPDTLAFLLYTSGSTGVPKGVGISHRAMIRMASGDGPARLFPQDRVACAASPSFDASLWEIWAPLLAGACIVGLPKEALLAPQRLERELSARRINALFVPTALLHTLAGEAPEAFRGLRLLLFGGEPADPVAVRSVLRAGPPDLLVHLYGPTEATTYATLQAVTEVAPAAAVPVGRPAAGRRVALLDASLSPVPLGTEGEVWIGGEGLARGYVAAPAATAASFLPDPFAAVPGARLYRTGDLGRFLPDGSLELRGRIDEQVKVRGCRVEPGEVRAALTAHPAVREAAVVVRRDSLELFVVLREESPAPAAELLADLRRRLPSWMVPSRLAVLPGLPRTATGKVDLLSLPEIAEPKNERSAAPRTLTERAVAEIWREILSREVHQAQDDFFALGGRSLEAARVTARAARAFGVQHLTVRDLYEAPTVEAFAQRLVPEERP